MTEKYADRLAALLRKAEGTSNAHERDAFMTKAQKLATQYQIDLETVRQRSTAKDRETVTTRSLRLGTPRTAGLASFAQLLNNIAKPNNVRLVMSPDMTHATLYGFVSDLDTVETLWTSLLLQMVTASQAYMDEGSYKTETVWRTRTVTEKDYWGRPHRVQEQGYFPVNGKTARLNFQYAFATRIGERLQDAVRQATAEYTGGSALVLRSRGDEVERFIKDNVKTRNRRASGISRVASAQAAGTAAGSRAALGGTGVSGARRQQALAG